MKNIRKAMILLIIITLSLTQARITVIHAEGLATEPTLVASQTGNHAKLEWAVEMLDEDVIYRTGFEVGQERPSLTFHAPSGPRRNGGQSFDTAIKYNGDYSLKINDTYNYSNYNFPDIYGNDNYTDFSIARFAERKYMENGTDLSLSFRAKTDGVADLRFRALGESADHGSPMSITFLEDVNIGDKTVRVSDPAFFKSYVDTGKRYHIANQKGRYSYIFIEAVDLENSTITVSGTGFAGEFKAGDPVLRHVSRSAVNFTTRTIEAKDDWGLFNVNAKVNNYSDFDVSVRGMILLLETSTPDSAYIDELEIGFATETELYRDGLLVYKGKLSDYEDTAAPDKSTPNMISDYIVDKNDERLRVTLTEPTDTGTTYNYQVKAISNDGSGVYYSDIEPVTITSGIKGYSYKVSPNSTDNPPGTINSSGAIDISTSVSLDDYLHIQTVDNAGNLSATRSIQIRDINDELPKITLTGYSEQWTKDAITSRLSIDRKYAMKQIVLPDGHIRETGFNQIDYTFVENGVHLFIFEDIKGNTLNYVVDVGNIDLINPTLDIVKSSNEWTNQGVTLTVTGQDSESGLRGLRLLTAPANKNILSLESILDSDEIYGSDEGERVFIQDNGAFTVNEGRSHFSGISIPYLRDLEDGKDYTLSFDITKLEGVVNVLGGHLKFSETTKVYLDGEEITEQIKVDEPNTWSGAIAYPDDTNTHHVEVQFTAGDGGSNTDKSINIQPNRYNGLKDYLILIENVQIEEGLRSTDYVLSNADAPVTESPLEHVATENGVYTFEATDNAGNSSTAAIEVGNIDKTSPNINIVKDIVENTHKDIVITVKATDSQSGVKSIKHDGVELPNGELIVTENGTYYFIVEDYAGNVSMREIDIDNIVRELSLKGPEIPRSTEVVLSTNMETHLPISSLTITDWRDGINDWKLSLESTKLTGPNELPSGTVSFKGVNAINQLGGEGSGPLSYLSKETIIDDGSVPIVDAYEMRGVYSVNFIENALKLNLTPDIVKKGTYNTTLTWTLESTLTIN